MRNAGTYNKNQQPITFNCLERSIAYDGKKKTIF